MVVAKAMLMAMLMAMATALMLLLMLMVLVLMLMLILFPFSSLHNAPSSYWLVANAAGSHAAWPLRCRPSLFAAARCPPPLGRRNAA
eukprot:6987562-Lingulodinium_polyedra.AAC.1